METAEAFKAGLRDFPELELMGDPKAMVIAFRPKNPKAINPFTVCDMLGKKGWSLNPIHRPNG